jgi:hypothetical protein
MRYSPEQKLKTGLLVAALVIALVVILATLFSVF